MFQLLKIYLTYYYDFELQCHLGAQKVTPQQQQQQQQQLGPLLDLTAIAAGKNHTNLNFPHHHESPK